MTRYPRRHGPCKARGPHWCELPVGHEGPHAAFTWEGCELPRVEWTNDELRTEGASPNQFTHVDRRWK